LSFGFYWQVKNYGLRPVKIPASHAGYSDEIISKTGGPFFHIMTENSTVKLFLDAVAQNTEEARCFLSKNCLKTIDLTELKETFEFGNYKYLIPAEISGAKNCRTNTVLLFNRSENEKIILRLYMVKEPDQFGQWKIFNVERE
jgi:hypothetical protein